MAMSNDTYSTSDTGLASYLLATNYRLVGNYTTEGRMWFTFSTDAGDVAVSVANYFSGEDDEVSASKYRDAERRIMDLVHKARREGVRR